MDELQKLKMGIQAGIDGNYPRKRAVPYNKDKISKLDKCPHDKYFYEDCEECLCDYLRDLMREWPLR